MHKSAYLLLRKSLGRCLQVLDEVRTLAKGVTGVPHFIIDDKYTLSGAQESDTFVNIFDKL